MKNQSKTKHTQIQKKASLDDALEYAENIIDTIREPLIVLDHDLRVVKASRSFYDFFKVKPEETMGQLIYDLGNRQWDIPKLRELLENILPQKTTFDNYEVKHNFTTIGKRIMLLNARQIKRVLGKERIILLAIEDITERKYREAEQKMTALLILLINQPDNFRKYMSDLTVSLQNFSGCGAVGIRLRDGDDYPYYETRGFPPEFVEMENQLCAYGPDGKILRDGTGNPLLECMCGNILCGRFDPQKPFFTAHGSFWSNNTTALLASTTDADRQARTRNRCNGEGYESVALIPLRINGNVLGLLQFNDHQPNRFTPGLIANFERMADSLAIALSHRQAMEALRESERLYEEAQKVAHLGHWELDPKIGTPKWSDEIFRIFGLDPKYDTPSFIDHETHLHPDDWPILNKAIAKTSMDGTSFNIQFRIVRPSGEIRWMNSLGTAIIDSKGVVSKLFGSAQDITEGKQAEKNLLETLDQLQKTRDMLIQLEKHAAVGRLAAGIAHEILNPASIISSRLQFMEKENLSESIRENVRVSREQLQRIVKISNDLSQSSVKKQRTLVDGDLCHVIEMGLQMTELRRKEDHVQVEYDPPSKVIPVKMEKDSLVKVMVNLILNACDAMTVNQTKRLIITVHYSEDSSKDYSIVLTIADNGHGVPVEKIDLIFEPFFTTKDPGKSSGLSLAISKNIIEEHGGTIRIGNNDMGGTSVIIRLPLDH